MAINTISLTNYLPHVETQVSSLPAELWLRILSHLPKIKLDSMSLVSHQIRDVMKSPVGLAQLMDNVYKYLRVSKRIEALLKCGPFLREMNAIFNAGILTPPILEELATKCKGVTSLHFNLFDKTLDVNPLLALPHLAKLDLTIGLEQPCDAVTLKLGLGLKELILENYPGTCGTGFYLGSVITQIKTLTKLEKLHISDTNFQKHKGYTFPTSLRELSLYPHILEKVKNVLQGNTNLVSLRLRGFANLKENDVDFIARCTQLTRLEVVEAKDFPYYTSLINLKSLWIKQLYPESVSFLSTFAQLEELCVSAYDEHEVSFPFETLTSLEKLTVRTESKFLIPPICYLSRLKYLCLLAPSEGDYKLLTALTQLEQMDLYGQTDENLRVIGLITSLKKLVLNKFNYAHDTIQCFTSLTSLEVYDCLTTTHLFALTSFSNLVHLEILGLDLDITPLRQCHALRDLGINYFGEASPLEEFKKLTQLESIHMDNIGDPRFYDKRAVRLR